MKSRRSHAHGLLVCLSAIVLVSGLFLSGCGHSAPAEPVTSYTPFVASDKSFSGEGPAGWETKATDMGGTEAHVTFDKDSAHINISSSAGASFLGDGLRTANKPAIDVIHEHGLAELQDKYADFNAGKATEMTSPLGQARYCEFQAKDGETPIHGYRVSIQGQERAIYVTTICPESDWAVLQPAFTKVIGSLKGGTG